MHGTIIIQTWLELLMLFISANDKGKAVHNGINCRSISIYEGEGILARICQSFSKRSKLSLCCIEEGGRGLNYTILRCTNTYGRSNPALPEQSSGYFIEKAIISMLRDEKEIKFDG